MSSPEWFQGWLICKGSCNLHWVMVYASWAPGQFWTGGKLSLEHSWVVVVHQAWPSDFRSYKERIRLSLNSTQKLGPEPGDFLHGLLADQLCDGHLGQFLMSIYWGVGRSCHPGCLFKSLSMEVTQRGSIGWLSSQATESIRSAVASWLHYLLAFWLWAGCLLSLSLYLFIWEIEAVNETVHKAPRAVLCS